MRRNLAPVIGWSPKEILWLRAALDLPAHEFLEACEDIASPSMANRTVAAVAAKARSLRADGGRGRSGIIPVPARTSVMVPAGARSLPPSALKPISDARKMGRRA